MRQRASATRNSIDLTMSVYTDPRLLDVAGALRALPELPLGAGPLPATGTDPLAK